jgi:hypothetical protein
METNKLLTLEEIEKIGSERYPARHGISGDDLEALLATARAYWELMDKLKKNIPMLRQWLNEDRKASPLVHSHDIAQWLEVPMEFKGYMSIADEQKIIDAVKPADNPHLPTLKVIVEAMKESNDYIWVDPVGAFIPMFSEELFIQSLEKHLE